METSLTAIPKIRRVYRDTYANLPTTGVQVEDLGFATDRDIFYRWSGVAWESLTIFIGYGLAAAKPAAADLPDGCLYQETDTTKLMEVQASAWVCIFYSGSGLAANIPAAAGMPEGVLYYETDTTILKQIQSGAWVGITENAATLIATHTAIATAHQNAPAIAASAIATHAGNANAHHTPPATRTIVSGSYAGNNAENRQITTGFKCSFVVIIGERRDGTTLYEGMALLIPNISGYADRNTVGFEAMAYLHASNGFIVSIGSGSSEKFNYSGETYYYWAISE